MGRNKLCLLDLDHTLIYGSYAPTEKTELLFEHSQYLKVYKRPFVEEFIDFLNHYYTHIIVYTTAKKDYANRICSDLGIHAIKILTRQDCKQKNNTYYKMFKSRWAKLYNSVHIVDDSPNVWLDTETYDKQITFVVPKEFRGEIDDMKLLELKESIKNNKTTRYCGV